MNRQNFPLYIAVLALALGFAWLAYIFNARQPKKTWTINSVTVLNTETTISGKISWEVNLCRYTDKEYVQVNYIKNEATGDAVLVNRIDDLKIKKGECKVLTQESIIPFHTGTGESQLFTRLTTRDSASQLYPPVEGISKPFIIK
jgi:hypothetical protein